MKKTHLSLIALLLAALLAFAAVPAGASSTPKAGGSGSTALLKAFSDPALGESHKNQYEQFAASTSLDVKEYDANDVAHIRAFMEQ